MAAIDIPWMTHMSTPRSTPRADVDADIVANPLSSTPVSVSSAANFPSPSYAPPTYASFSPANLSSPAAAAAAKRTSTILVHQKSPLLLATPPQVTRALAYSHPFLLPLNKLVGLLSWTTGDPWESFLLLVVFWAVVQYGDTVIRFAGPIVGVLGIIAGMYARRYSPLSSSGRPEHPSPANSKDKKRAGNAASTGNPAGPAHQRNASEITGTRHQKTLDEIVDTVKVLTSRCNILLEPLLEMTDFLSTQRTATSATTRPALTTLFVRIFAVTPIWIALTMPPLRIITTKRVVLVFGTVVLSWHSKVCGVTRTLLWRSATVRKLARWITGLEFEGPLKVPQGQPRGIPNGATQQKRAHEAAKISSSALTEALKRSQLGSKDSGVRFTFILYENQRRWLGLGWTNSLFAYERSAWTDEQNNPVPPKEDFELPEVEDGRAKWRWVKGGKWRVDGVVDMDEADYDSEAGRMGWIFYDNKWQNGRRGNDGWGRWTRRRKWYRDAELVEVGEDDSPQPTPPALPARPQPIVSPIPDSTDPDTLSTSAPETINSDGKGKGDDDAASLLSTSSKSAKFRFPGSSIRRRTASGMQRTRRASETASLRSNDGDSTLDPALELEIQGHQREQGQWGIGDDAQMGLE
ncbi:putative integral peroxisomal membrane peroxin [Rosellinia necatrix]|uniref:Putative integral peroxisomal membrane peroxin n=1 Tax=Rosellinia necatrix TaxID=77044 RepID=A0A1W2TXA7_ROSNE|nr:putative integral peroxisomal membrane peroxin [Rosellinia necatrix]